MEQHKIQSAGGLALHLTLDPVPKLLAQLREWCPLAYTVTFKLETDASILESKVRTSLSNYGQAAVVANLLSSHRDRVSLFFATGESINIDRGSVQAIELRFVPTLCDRHKQFFSQ